MQLLLTIVFAVIGTIAFAGILIYAVRSECLSEPCVICRRPLPEGQRGLCERCCTGYTMHRPAITPEQADRAAAAVIQDRPIHTAP